MLIQITQEDINVSRRKNTTKCIISTAIKKLLKASLVVSTFPYEQWMIGIHFPDSSKFLAEIALPKEIELQIEAFEAGYPVQPFSFNLDIPKEFLL